MFSPTRLNIHHLLNFIFRLSKGAKQCKLLGPPEIVPATHQSLFIYLFIYVFANNKCINFDSTVEPRQYGHQCRTHEKFAVLTVAGFFVVVVVFLSQKCAAVYLGGQKSSNEVAVRRKVTCTYKHYLVCFVNKSDFNDKGYSK